MISSRFSGSSVRLLRDAPLRDGRASLGRWIFGALIFGACSRTAGLGTLGISVTVPTAGRVVGASARPADDDHIRQVLLRVDVVLAGLLRLRIDDCGIGGDLLGARGEAL